MPLPTNTVVLTMDFCLDGVPYVNVCANSSIDIDGMEFCLDALPWRGTKLESSEEAPSGYADLASIIAAEAPYNLNSIIKGVYTDSSSLASLLYSYQVDSFSSSINVATPKNLYALIEASAPLDIRGNIEGVLPSNLMSYIMGVGEGGAVNVGAYICGHSHIDLMMYSNVFQRNQCDLGLSIRSWAEDNLNANIKNCFDSNLLSILFSDVPRDLYANLKAWYYNNIYGTIGGWDVSSILASIYPLSKEELSSYLFAIAPFNLKAFIQTIIQGASDLNIGIRAYQTRDLGGDVYSLYIKDLTSYLYPIVSHNLSAGIHSYAEQFLSGYLLGLAYPYNLTASIFASGSLLNLSACISVLKALVVVSNLSAVLGGYQTQNIFANIFSISGYDLKATITSSSYSSNLQSILIPKVVRLSKVVNVFTVEKYDLSAMVNASCFGSNINHLSAYIKVIYLSYLPATINGVAVFEKNYANLTATIGFSSRVIVTDKLPITIQTLGDKLRVMDMLPLAIHIYGASQHLSASIQGALIPFDLSASIKAIGIKDYAVTKGVSRALVYDLKRTYGRAALSSIVELYFKNYIRDYIYLQEAGLSFSSNAQEKWEIDISSYLPANTSLGLKRRFCRAVTLYKLTSYTSINEAVKDAIVYITEDSFSNLSATINLYFNSMSSNLLARVTPLYTRTKQEDLSSTIVADVPDIIYNKGIGGFVGKV